jgi:2-polyprenyl-3-methyl-5-hydroxy-6-metoxy-1,4-benzoquinol methylase
MTAPAPAPGTQAEIPTGNTFDKYGSGNPLYRRLMAGFAATADALLEQAAPSSVLDVGCGEGVLTERWARALAPRPVIGIDLPDPELQAQWHARQQDNLEFCSGRAESLPFGDDEVDLVAAIETLEHVPDPVQALVEMTRVARRHLLVSVPREPLWRGLNLARGAYLSRLGNTPGHLSHWSRRGFRRLLAAHGEVVELRSPLPWTMALVRVPR